MKAYVWKEASKPFELMSGRYQGTMGVTIVFRELESERQYKLYLPLNYPQATWWLTNAKKGNVFYGLGRTGANTIPWWLMPERVEIKKANQESESAEANEA